MPRPSDTPPPAAPAAGTAPAPGAEPAAGTAPPAPSRDWAALDRLTASEFDFEPVSAPSETAQGAPTPPVRASAPAAPQKATMDKAEKAAQRAKARAEAKATRAANRRALTPPRRRYPIGELQQAALRRGRAIVEQSGANALTVRGLARDLGVSAPALLYYFGTRDGLRQAVAERVQEELAGLSVQPMANRAHADLGEMGENWIAFAEANANLYRLAFGEGWRPTGQGWRPAWLGLPLPTQLLEYRVRRGLWRIQSPEPVPPEQVAPLAHQVAVGIHGLASARADGAPAWMVREALSLMLRNVPAGRAPRIF